MATGQKRLGHPSEKLSGDVPRASWRAVFFSEIVWPIVMAVIFTIAYMFVKSFPDRTGTQPPSPLIRIAVISVGPVVWNAGVLVAQFLISPGTYARPHVPQVWFYRGTHRSRARITWDHQIL